MLTSLEDVEAAGTTEVIATEGAGTVDDPYSGDVFITVPENGDGIYGIHVLLGSSFGYHITFEGWSPSGLISADSELDESVLSVAGTFYFYRGGEPYIQIIVVEPEPEYPDLIFESDPSDATVVYTGT